MRCHLESMTYGKIVCMSLINMPLKRIHLTHKGLGWNWKVLGAQNCHTIHTSHTFSCHTLHTCMTDFRHTLHTSMTNFVIHPIQVWQGSNRRRGAHRDFKEPVDSAKCGAERARDTTPLASRWVLYKPGKAGKRTCDTRHCDKGRPTGNLRSDVLRIGRSVGRTRARGDGCEIQVSGQKRAARTWGTGLRSVHLQ